MIALAFALTAQITLPFARDVLVTDTGALLLLPPLHIAGPMAMSWEWSADGKLLAVRAMDGPDAMMPVWARTKAEPDFEACVIVWNASTRKFVEPFRKRKVALSEMVWMGNHLAFQVVEMLPSGPNRPEPQTRETIFLWSPGTTSPSAALTRDKDADEPALWELNGSSKLPYGLVRSLESSEGKAWVIAPGRQPVPTEVPFGFLSSDRDGKLIVTQHKRNPAGGEKPLRSYARIEPSGQVVPLSAEPPGFNPRDEKPVDDSTKPTAASAGIAYGKTEVKLVNGWLTGRKDGKPTAALVATDTDRVSLSPDGKYALYLSQGSLYARPIKALSPEDYEAMLDAAEKMELMSRAKQIGTCAHIFAADNDDKFPLKDGFMNSLLPYAKNADWFQGFVYELNGDDSSKIDDPANKVMGYIQGRKGRAVVFADSHVKWVANKGP